MDPKKIDFGQINLEAIWKKVNGAYVSSDALFIGKLKVAEYFYNGSRPAGDPKKYKVISPIPTIKSNLGNYETEKECIEICERVAKTIVSQLTDLK